MPTLDDPLSPADALTAELVRITRAQSPVLEDEAEEAEEAPLCDHAWERVSDWYGDPTLYNGTADCSYWRCLECDEERNEQPRELEERAMADEAAAAEAEYRRDCKEDR